jgi:hypothetical protein
MIKLSVNLLTMKLKKLYIFFSAVIFVLLINVLQLKAQDTPPIICGDPDIEDCPIDAPVILLGAAVLFLAVKKIYATQHNIK